ncbi:hypothetical protein HC864_05780 [Candidatus Gracilibacteria bacterium]|nr:hypothetical protein [Candidatus Gracilibacteria bacterium]
MLKFSNLIHHKKNKNKVLKEAYIKLQFQKNLEKFILSVLGFQNLEKAELKYFLQEKDKEFIIKIKTSTPIHSVILKTEKTAIENQTIKILKSLNISKQPKVLII